MRLAISYNIDYKYIKILLNICPLPSKSLSQLLSQQ